MQFVDEQYFELLSEILNHGMRKDTRAGETLSIFGHTMRFYLQDGFPLLTTKKMYYNGIIHELLWFLSGSTNIKYLVDNKVNIWTDDAYRFYLENVKKSNQYLENAKKYISENSLNVDSSIMDMDIYKLYPEKCRASITDLITNLVEEIQPLTKEEFLECVKDGKYFPFIKAEEEYTIDDLNLLNIKGTDEIKDVYHKYYIDLYTYGDLGPIYSKQWRNYGVSGFDQIQNIIDTLKTNPDDRRMIINAWNPDVFDEIALPACHSFAQFYSYELSFGERLDYLDKIDKEGKYAEWKYPSPEKLDELGVPRRGLSCYFYCRSQDVPLGTPFNIASYALLTCMIAQCVGMLPSDLVYSGGDCHIYRNQIDGVVEQLKRNPHQYNLPTLWLNPEIKEINDFKFEDIRIDGYKSFDAIKFPLSTGLDKVDKKEEN